MKLTRYTSSPPRFELSWPDIGGEKVIKLGLEEIWSWSIVQRALFGTWDIIPENMPSHEWHDLLRFLNDTGEKVEEFGASVEAEVLDMLESWIEGSVSDSWSLVDLATIPIRKEGFCYFKVDTFESQVLFARSSRFYFQRYLIGRSKVYEILRGVGARSVVKKFRKNKARRVWEIREDFNKPIESPEGELLSDEEEVQAFLEEVGVE